MLLLRGRKNQNTFTVSNENFESCSKVSEHEKKHTQTRIKNIGKMVHAFGRNMKLTKHSRRMKKKKFELPYLEKMHAFWQKIYYEINLFATF